MTQSAVGRLRVWKDEILREVGLSMRLQSDYTPTLKGRGPLGEAAPKLSDWRYDGALYGCPIKYDALEGDWLSSRRVAFS